MKKQLFAMFTFALLVLSMIPTSLAVNMGDVLDSVQEVVDDSLTTNETVVVSSDSQTGDSVEEGVPGSDETGTEEISDEVGTEIPVEEGTEVTSAVLSETPVEEATEEAQVQRQIRERVNDPRLRDVSAIRAKVAKQVRARTNATVSAKNVLVALRDRYKGLDADKQEKIQAIYKSISAEQKRALRNLDSAVAEKISELDEEQAKKIMSLSRFAINNVDKLSNANSRAKLIKRVEQVDELRKKSFKMRELAEKDIKKARDQIDSARNRYKNLKLKHKEIRERFNASKDKILLCKENPDAEECVEATEQSKEFVKNTVELIVASLEKLQGEVEASEYLSEDEVAEQTAQISAMIEELNADSAKLDEAETFKEVREIAKDVNAVASRARRQLKFTAGSLINNKVRSIIARADSLQKRLELVVEHLDAAGIDTSSLDDKIIAFNDKISLAFEKYELAKEKWIAAKDAQDVDELIKEANGYMSEARVAIKDAQNILKDMMVTAKELQREAGLSDEDVEQEIETSDDSADDSSEDSTESTDTSNQE